VVERVSGEDYFGYVRTHLFDVAKMRDTGSFEVDEDVPNLAVGYGPDDIFGRSELSSRRRDARRVARVPRCDLSDSTAKSRR
jgi:CubicO group peptidase (beta-lactamase class C family)